MFCKNCGATLNDGQTHCHMCGVMLAQDQNQQQSAPTGGFGAPTPMGTNPGTGGYGTPMGPKDPGKGFSIAGLVLGIVAVALSWSYGVGLICGIIGIVMAVLGKKKSTEAGFVNTGMATAGLVLSIIGTCFAGLLTVICVSACSCTTCGNPYYYSGLYY